MCQLSRNLRSINLLELQGSVQACNGTALINQLLLIAAVSIVGLTRWNECRLNQRKETGSVTYHNVPASEPFRTDTECIQATFPNGSVSVCVVVRRYLPICKLRVYLYVYICTCVWFYIRMVLCILLRECSSVVCNNPVTYRRSFNESNGT
jgi:hypothetical protein